MSTAQAKVEQGKEAKNQTIDDILSRKKPNVRIVEICLDSDLAAEINEVERELEQAKMKRNRQGRTLADSTGALQTRLDELMERAAEESVSFTFKDIGRRAFDQLIMDHPPSKAQKDRHAEMGGGLLEYDIDTFPPALIAATCADPKMTIEDAERIFDEWGSGEAEYLFAQAILVCKERTSLPLSKNGTEPMGDSA